MAFTQRIATNIRIIEKSIDVKGCELGASSGVDRSQNIIAADQQGDNFFCKIRVKTGHIFSCFKL